MRLTDRHRMPGACMQVACVVAMLAALCSGLLTTPADAATGTSRWVLPLAGPPVVVRAFAPPSTPYGPGHRGVDLAGLTGAAVRAAGAGRVTYAGLLAGRGVVVVAHGLLRTTYEPVDAAVRVGAGVDAGTVIGHLEAAPLGHCDVQPCLHWGLLRGAVYLDPMSLVGPTQVRLLPLWSDGVPAPRSSADPARVGAGPRPAGARAAAARPRPASASHPMSLVAAVGGRRIAASAGLTLMGLLAAVSLAAATLGRRRSRVVAGVVSLADRRRGPPGPGGAA